MERQCKYDRRRCLLNAKRAADKEAQEHARAERFLRILRRSGGFVRKAGLNDLCVCTSFDDTTLRPADSGHVLLHWLLPLVCKLRCLLYLCAFITAEGPHVPRQAHSSSDVRKMWSATERSPQGCKRLRENAADDAAIRCLD
jgi:hypothetical protein